MLTIDSRLRVPSHVTSSSVDSDIVLLNTRTNQYFALQDVASRMWTLIKQGNNLRNVVLILKEEYTVRPGELEEDILELVRDLLESDLVELVEA